MKALFELPRRLLGETLMFIGAVFFIGVGNAIFDAGLWVYGQTLEEFMNDEEHGNGD